MGPQALPDAWRMAAGGHSPCIRHEPPPPRLPGDALIELNLRCGDSPEHLKQAIEADFKSTSGFVVTASERLQLAVESEHQPTGYTTQFPDPAASHPALWDESLTLGLLAIDEQHKAIAAICEKLMKNPDESAHSEYSVDCLIDLGKILALHFEVEEAHMQQLGMVQEEFAAHRAKHTELLDRYAEMSFTFYTDRDLKVRDIAAQVREWTIDHVIKFDFNITTVRLIECPNRPTP